VRGFGPAKTAQVLAAIELGKRAATLLPEQRPQVKSPRDVANLLMSDMAYLALLIRINNPPDDESSGYITAPDKSGFSVR